MARKSKNTCKKLQKNWWKPFFLEKSQIRKNIIYERGKALCYQTTCDQKRIELGPFCQIGQQFQGYCLYFIIKKSSNTCYWDIDKEKYFLESTASYISMFEKVEDLFLSQIWCVDSSHLLLNFEMLIHHAKIEVKTSQPWNYIFEHWPGLKNWKSCWKTQIGSWLAMVRSIRPHNGQLFTKVRPKSKPNNNLH